MIYLVTGETGAGKTAHIVDMIAHDEQFKNRPLFVMGVPDLAIEHQPCPPISQWTEKRADPDDPSLELDYFTFPEDAVIILDEAQRVYRPRALGSPVPAHVAAFETHRHCGIDFFLITQVQTQIDSHARKLVNRHIHIRVNYLGRQRYEWMGLGDPESSSSRELAARTKYELPKRAFSLYKSSQKHTVLKKSIPFYFWIFGIASLATIALVYYGYTRITGKIADAQVDKTPGLDAAASSRPSQQASVKPEHVTTLEYVETRQPRINGMLHTAPVYDAITTPTVAPVLTGCYVFKGSCKCKDQQGTPYITTDTICRDFVKNGAFRDWVNPDDKGDRATGAAGARPLVVKPSSNA